jgi:DNA repair protein RadC
MRAETYVEKLRGASKRELIATVMELARRCYDLELREPVPVSRPREAYRQVRDLARSRQEQLVGLYLDSQNKLIVRRTISVGSLNTTRTHPREILYPAVQHLACGFILAHNHPSGCLEPSAEDIEFTGAVRRAGELLGIELYDHLIVTRDGFTSLRERGLL